MLLIELGLIFWGIFIIGSNRVSLYKYRVVHGRPATIIGWLLLVPIGAGIALGCKRVHEMRKLGRMPDLTALQDLTVDVAIVELIAIGFTLLLSAIIFCCYMERPGGYRPPWEGDDYQRWCGGDKRGASRVNSEDFLGRE